MDRPLALATPMAKCIPEHGHQALQLWPTPHLARHRPRSAPAPGWPWRAQPKRKDWTDSTGLSLTKWSS